MEQYGAKTSFLLKYLYFFLAYMIYYLFINFNYFINELKNWKEYMLNAYIVCAYVNPRRQHFILKRMYIP